MDDRTLTGLKAALAATPENAKLLALVMGAMLDRDECADALALLGDREPGHFSDDADILIAARVCLASGEAERALAFASMGSAEALMLRARALASLDRNEEGRAAYDQAVIANPALEDPSLRTRLASHVRTFPGADDRHTLKVIERGPRDGSDLNQLLMPETEKVTFADVGGLDEIKEQIRKRIILPFQKPTLYQKFKKRVGGGILLYGPPGCGKTLLARATAGECHAQFYNVAISDVLDMYVGESEAKMHAIFEKARATPPAVMFFDEIEALGGKRQYSRESLTSKLVSLFLSEMDGFARNNQGVLILAATNVPWSVDAAFMRPGRFDRFLFVPPPDRPARATILSLHLAGRPTEGKMDIEHLAKGSSGYSGADLRNIVETAADHAIEETLATGQEVPIRDAHLKSALRELKPTTLEWLTTARNYARYANESGQYDAVLAFLDKSGRG